MPALLAMPEATPAPAILIANDVVGRSPFYEHLAARLADTGFVALEPEFFFRLGALPELTLEHAIPRARGLNMVNAVEDMSSALDWLKGRDFIQGERLGVVGFCMGGTFGMVLSAKRQDVASVTFYGFPQGSGRGENASLRPIDLVDSMQGPMLGFWGDLDDGVGMDNVRDFARAAQDRGVDFSYEIYPGIEHGFMRHSGFEPDHPAYEVAVASWQRTVSFFRENL
ncbi:MAG: dienelactone hydrolase family protein [Opitutaceae bacterium]